MTFTYKKNQEGSWPEAMVEDLKRLHAEGQSFGQIAKMLSARHRTVTRSAAIGKAMRLGLAGHGQIKSARGRPRERSAPISRKQSSQIAQASQWNKPPRSAPPEIPRHEPQAVDLALEPAPNSTAERHSILRRNADGALEANTALTEKCCRWPIGDPASSDFYFCCRDKIPGTSYCESHAKRAFQAPLPARAREKVKEYAE